MQTVIIYDQLDAQLKFIVLDGDYVRFSDVYINQYFEGSKAEQKSREKLQDELSNLIYDEKTGEVLVTMLSEFPVEAVRNGAAIIVAGFLP